MNHAVPAGSQEVILAFNLTTGHIVLSVQMSLPHLVIIILKFLEFFLRSFNMHQGQKNRLWEANNLCFKLLLQVLYRAAGGASLAAHIKGQNTNSLTTIGNV